MQTEDALLAAMDARVPRLEVSPARPSPDLSYWYGSSRGPGQDYWVHTRTRARPRRHGSEQGDSPTGGPTWVSTVCVHHKCVIVDAKSRDDMSMAKLV